jgi:hypothetical protein
MPGGHSEQPDDVWSKHLGRLAALLNRRIALKATAGTRIPIDDTDHTDKQKRSSFICVIGRHREPDRSKSNSGNTDSHR